MKHLASVALLALCGITMGCAGTTFYSRTTGKPVAKWQGDMVGSSYHEVYPGGSVSWEVQQVSHSAATLAQGAAASNVITSVGSAAAGVALAAGNSGLFSRAAGVAIPAVLQVAQPRPAVLNAH